MVICGKKSTLSCLVCWVGWVVGVGVGVDVDVGGVGDGLVLMQLRH